VALAFGWNQSLSGVAVDWALAAQNAVFVYLGADDAYEEHELRAIEAGLLVGPYWTLDSDLDPQRQADLFLGRFGGTVEKDQLPPAVFVKRGKLATLKTFVEVVEKATKRRTLIGGTPQSLSSIKAGLVFGRTNPLWISHKPAWGGPRLPDGWERFAVWQTPPPRPLKGVGIDVGYNVAADSFIRTGNAGIVAFGLLGAVVLGSALYYAGKGSR